MLSPEEFRKYLQLAAELHGYASQIISWVNKNVLSVLGGTEVQKGSASFTKWPKEVQEAVVAGLVVEPLKTPYYSPNAYAMFLKDFLGVYLENPAAYVEKLVLGSELTDIDIVFEKTMFLEFVERIYKITGFILNKAREVGVEVALPKPVEVTQETIIADMIEKFIEKAYEVTVGVNRFATAVWSLRKITPGYLKAIYGEAPQQLLDALGFRQLLKTKYVELWGFEDYFTELSIYCIEVYSRDCRYYAVINNVPTPLGFLEYINKRTEDVAKRTRVLRLAEEVHKPRTVGGALCTLNEAVWKYLRRLSSIGTNWFSNYTNLEKEYVDIAWIRLGEYGWSIPEYLNVAGMPQKHNVSSEYPEISLSMMYDKEHDRVIGEIETYRGYCSCSERYFGGVIKEGLVYPKLSSITKLFYDLMPAIIYGVVDVTLKTRLCGRYEKVWCCEIRTRDCDEVCRDVNSITMFFRIFK
jgi:hypothetical protein